jgi:hypothetical protein
MEARDMSNPNDWGSEADLNELAKKLRAQIDRWVMVDELPAESGWDIADKQMDNVAKTDAEDLRRALMQEQERATSLADQAGILLREKRDLLSENARLRREVERLERLTKKGGKR